jgi:hypothetical protein
MLANQKTYLRVTLGLAAAGTLFSGYLNTVRLFTGSCAFNESCPFFSGLSGVLVWLRDVLFHAGSDRGCARGACKR